MCSSEKLDLSENPHSAVPSAVAIVPRLMPGQRMNRGSIPRRGKRFFPTPKRLQWLRDQTRTIFNGYGGGGLFPRGYGEHGGST